MYDFAFRRLPAALLLVTFGLIVVHAPLAVVVGTQIPDLALAIKAWKEPLIITALALVIVDVITRRRFDRLKRDLLLWLMVGYVVLHGLMALLFSGILVFVYPQVIVPAVAGLAVDLRYILYFMAVYLFLKQYPGYRRLFIKIGVIGALVVVGFAMLQQVLPPDFLKHLGYGPSTIMPYLTVDKNDDFIRINSTLRGPNPLGAYAAIVLTGCVAYAMFRFRNLANRTKRYVFVVLAVGSVVALWTSYSRSAVIAAAIGVGIVLMARYAKTMHWRHWAAIGAVIVVALGGLYVARDTAFVHNVILHDNPTTGADVTSNAAHAESLIDGTDRMLRQPLGAGVGSTGSASLFGESPLIIENQYLFVAHESGWLGFGLFIAITIVTLRRLWRARNDWLAMTVFGSGVGLALICLIQPVWVDDTVSIVWWGLAAIALVTGGNNERTTNKKAKRIA